MKFHAIPVVKIDEHIYPAVVVVSAKSVVGSCSTPSKSSYLIGMTASGGSLGTQASSIHSEQPGVGVASGFSLDSSVCRYSTEGGLLWMDCWKMK